MSDHPWLDRSGAHDRSSTPDRSSTRDIPLVLVHGLWDTPSLFDLLKTALAGRRQPLLIPHLPHRWGATSLAELAGLLGNHIDAAFGIDQPVDLLGFSMGGVVGRYWIQIRGGHRRTRRLFSVGSPQRGTWAAIPIPAFPLRGIAEMKPGSDLLRLLDADLSNLQRVDCRSYYCASDLTVFPGWRATLPLGPSVELPVQSHRAMITHPRALEILCRDLLMP